MLQLLLKFIFFLLLVLGLGYMIHIYFVSIISPEASLDLINFSYKFNVGFTFLFTSTIIILSSKFKNQIGLIFLVTSAVKMGIFLFIIETSDFSINKSVFLHFFIPYVLCLVLEITYIIKVINSVNYNNHK